MAMTVTSPTHLCSTGLRKWGIDHVLFGSDYFRLDYEETPRDTLRTLARYPFTQAEINTILSNDGSDWLGLAP